MSVDYVEARTTHDVANAAKKGMKPGTAQLIILSLNAFTVNKMTTSQVATLVLKFRKNTKNY